MMVPKQDKDLVFVTHLCRLHPLRLFSWHPMNIHPVYTIFPALGLGIER